MTYNQSLLSVAAICGLLFIPLALLINNYAYDDNGQLVCSNYVLNSYLYVMAGFCIIAIGALLEQHLQLVPTYLVHKSLIATIASLIIMIIILIGIAIYIRSSNPQTDFALIHIAFATYCLLIGMLICVTLTLGINTGMLNMAILLTIILTAIMAYIGYEYGDQLISVDFDKYLRYSLLALIIWTIVARYIISDPVIIIYSISIPAVIIFALLLMSYNNQLRKNQESCTVPNYPSEAIGLIIKIVNLLQNILRLLFVRKAMK